MSRPASAREPGLARAMAYRYVLRTPRNALRKFMHEQSLRVVLLIKAIEEADRTGAILPPAERVAASRDARRDAGPARGASEPGAGAGQPGAALTGADERMLAKRARQLHERIVARHPFVDAVVRAAGGVRAASLLMIVLGALVGVGLSALDGSQRINILAPGLIALVLWNLLVYLLLFVRALRGSGAKTVRRATLAGLFARRATASMMRLIARSAAFNAPLADALRRFGAEWGEAARPLLAARATRVIHLAAAAAGLGLIAGLYLRGLTLDYQAGWESTLLAPAQVATLLEVLYGPPALLLSHLPWTSGIVLPDAAQLEALRWRNESGVLVGGERATRWLHLFAATAALYIVVPRLALALQSSIAIWRLSRHAPVPATLAGYFRKAFGAVDSSIGRGIVMVVPYAYEPASASLAQARTLLPGALGDNLAVDLRAPVAYGDEDEFVAHLADRGGAIADVVVLMFNLAATPEDENHGAIVSGVRDWIAANRQHAQLLVLVDEAPYAVRMGAAGAGRLDERRRAWQDFIAARGLHACTMDLSAAPVEASAAEPLRAQLRNAIWQPA